MKYLFIDGNNLGMRAAWANKNLRVNFIDYSQDFDPDKTLDSSNLFPTGAIHGFFRSVDMVMRDYPDRFICVAWDGKSKARVLDSRDAVERGIIPQEYKGNRPTGDKRSPEVVDFHRQRPVIMEALSKTNIPQILKADEEADDIIASFTAALKGNDIMIMTNDQDYYQLLGSGVTILNASGSVLTEEWFRRAFGISPDKWVDVGALQGDQGDNIFGLPWWGETTAIKEIAKHGTCEAVMASYIATYGHFREKFPDLKGDDFLALRNLKTADDRPKFPHVKEWMPFTGVAMAYDQGKAKLPRNAVMALVYQDRVPLAKRLKAMRTQIKLPKFPADLGRDLGNEFTALCTKYDLNGVASVAGKLCARQVMS